MADAPLDIRRERYGRLLRLRLNRPKANLIDGEMIAPSGFPAGAHSRSLSGSTQSGCSADA